MTTTEIARRRPMKGYASAVGYHRRARAAYARWSRLERATWARMKRQAIQRGAGL